MSIRDTIQAADDIEKRLIEVPEWDVTIEMRSPTVAARGAAMSEYMNGTKVDYARMYPSLVIQCAYDPEDGSKLFTVADIEWLGEKSAAAMERLGDVALELSGLKDAVARVEAGKDDSNGNPNDDTNTGSPNDSE